MSRSLCNVSTAGATALIASLLLACSGSEGPPPDRGMTSNGAAQASAAPPTPAAPAAPAAPLTAADCAALGVAPTAPSAPVDTNGRKAEVAATFARHRDRFRCCYDVARRDMPRLEGKYGVEVVLKTDGTLKSVQAARPVSEFVDDKMEACVQGVVKTLSFAPNSEGKESTVVFPFTFTPNGAKLTSAAAPRLAAAAARPRALHGGHAGLARRADVRVRLAVAAAHRAVRLLAGADRARPALEARAVIRLGDSPRTGAAAELRRLVAARLHEVVAAAAKRPRLAGIRVALPPCPARPDPFSGRGVVPRARRQ
jgi:hypothetical protein